MDLTSTKGFMCVFTLDRIDDLRRFLTSFNKYNDFPIVALFARDIKDAHKLKTLCAFFTPFEHTAFLDIDMLVNGNLNALFSTATQGKIGIIKEKTVPVLNSGVLVFPKTLMQGLCTHWNRRYEKSVALITDQIKGTWEQGLLNNLIVKFPHVELPSEFNHIIKDCSPEEELKIYDTIKIFHFLHHSGIEREKYKSYQEFMKL